MAFAAFEIYISKLPAINSKISPKPYVLSPLQPVTRDLTFVLESNQTVPDLISNLEKRGKRYVNFFKRYRFFLKMKQFLGKKKIDSASMYVSTQRKNIFPKKELHDLMDQLIQAAKI